MLIYTRLLISPVKKKFVIDPMNLVDLSTLIPFYLAILLEELEDYEIIGKAGKILRLLKVMNINVTFLITAMARNEYFPPREYRMER